MISKSIQISFFIINFKHNIWFINQIKSFQFNSIQIISHFFYSKHTLSSKKWEIPLTMGTTILSSCVRTKNVNDRRPMLWVKILIKIKTVRTKKHNNNFTFLSPHNYSFCHKTALPHCHVRSRDIMFKCPTAESRLYQCLKAPHSMSTFLQGNKKKKIGVVIFSCPIIILI